MSLSRDLDNLVNTRHEASYPSVIYYLDEMTRLYRDCSYALLLSCAKQPGMQQKHADWSMRQQRRAMQVYVRFGKSPEYQCDCGLGGLLLHQDFDGGNTSTRAS